MQCSFIEVQIAALHLPKVFQRAANAIAAGCIKRKQLQLHQLPRVYQKVACGTAAGCARSCSCTSSSGSTSELQERVRLQQGAPKAATAAAPSSRGAPESCMCDSSKVHQKLLLQLYVEQGAPKADGWVHNNLHENPFISTCACAHGLVTGMELFGTCVHAWYVTCCCRVFCTTIVPLRVNAGSFTFHINNGNRHFSMFGFQAPFGSRLFPLERKHLCST